jgi:hypothetical protein
VHLLSNFGQHFILQITSPRKKGHPIRTPLWRADTGQVLVARVSKQLRSAGGCNKADDMALRDIVEECNNKLPRAFKKRQYNCWLLEAVRRTSAKGYGQITSCDSPRGVGPTKWMTHTIFLQRKCQSLADYKVNGITYLCVKRLLNLLYLGRKWPWNLLRPWNRSKYTYKRWNEKPFVTAGIPQSQCMIHRAVCANKTHSNWYCRFHI